MRTLSALFWSISIAQCLAEGKIAQDKVPPVISLDFPFNVHITSSRSCLVFSNNSTCPEPTPHAFDIHEGVLDEKVVKSVYLLSAEPPCCVSGSPAAVMDLPTEVPDIDYSTRGEFLLTYEVSDSSGNEAEQVEYNMRIVDHEPPEFVSFSDLGFVESGDAVPIAGNGTVFEAARFPLATSTAALFLPNSTFAQRYYVEIPLKTLGEEIGNVVAEDAVDGDVGELIQVHSASMITRDSNDVPVNMNLVVISGSTKSGSMYPCAPDKEEQKLCPRLLSLDTVAWVPSTINPDTHQLGGGSVVLNSLSLAQVTITLSLRDAAGEFGLRGMDNVRNVNITITIQDTSPPVLMLVPDGDDDDDDLVEDFNVVLECDSEEEWYNDGAVCADSRDLGLGLLMPGEMPISKLSCNIQPAAIDAASRSCARPATIARNSSKNYTLLYGCEDNSGLRAQPISREVAVLDTQPPNLTVFDNDRYLVLKDTAAGINTDYDPPPAYATSEEVVVTAQQEGDLLHQWLFGIGNTVPASSAGHGSTINGGAFSCSDRCGDGLRLDVQIHKGAMCAYQAFTCSIPAAIPDEMHPSRLHLCSMNGSISSLPAQASDSLVATFSDIGNTNLGTTDAAGSRALTNLLQSEANSQGANTSASYSVLYSCVDAAGNVAMQCRRFKLMAPTLMANLELVPPVVQRLQAYNSTKADPYEDPGAVCFVHAEEPTLPASVYSSINTSITKTTYRRVASATVQITPSAILESERVVSDIAAAFGSPVDVADTQPDTEQSVWIEVPSGVKIDVPGIYVTRYDCQAMDPDSRYAVSPAEPLYRWVEVVDSMCPRCDVNGMKLEVEASFPVDWLGSPQEAAHHWGCSDNLDGPESLLMIQLGTVDVEVTGTYHISYLLRDTNQNWNYGLRTSSFPFGGGNCATPQTYVRTVVVVDTLKPVIALKHDHASAVDQNRRLAEVSQRDAVRVTVTTQNSNKAVALLAVLILMGVGVIVIAYDTVLLLVFDRISGYSSSALDV